MNITAIIYPILAIGGMGLLFGIGLGIASKKFAVPVDERVGEIRENLPGVNCGGCGFAGCDAFAKAVAEGEAKPSGCPVSSDEQRVAIAKLMGTEVVDGPKQVAIIRCQGSHEIAKQKYNYEGIPTCEDAHLIGGGPKACSYGCLGYGSCQKACPFDAITIENGLAVIHRDKCKACSACVSSCPRDLIYIGQADAKYQVACKSYNKGKVVKASCTLGCIGCGLCIKQCEFEAISLEKGLATIDEAKCTACGKCISKCPTHAITLCD